MAGIHCPFSIYNHGGIALASSIFVDRYVDKSFSHTVRVRNEDMTCVGLIVDENHVLTTSDCASSEAHNGSLALEETKCTFKNRTQCLTALLKTRQLLQTRAIAEYRMHPFVFTFGSDEMGLSLPVNALLSIAIIEISKIRWFLEVMISNKFNIQIVD
uniref:Peptidase S1 domain-containing protein n=1 Tax=Anopheles culicifacies TaxID=139723 RepID=A0A182MCG0_9DIPT